MKTKLLLFLSVIIFSVLSTRAVGQSLNIDWQKCFGGSGDEGAADMIRTKDGGYLIVANTSAEVEDGDITGSGKHALNVLNRDFWVVKLDHDAKLVWSKCFGGSKDDDASAVQELNGGGYVIAGETESTDGDVTFNAGGDSDAWIIKLNAGGALVWQKTFGGDGADRALDIIETSDDGLLMVGRTDSKFWADGSPTGVRGLNDAWVVKFSVNGSDIPPEIQFQQLFGGSKFDEARSVFEAKDGYIFAGVTASNDFDFSNCNNSNPENVEDDAYVAKLDKTNGNVLFMKCYVGGTYLSMVIPTADNGFVFVGALFKNPQPGVVFDNAWVVKCKEDFSVEHEFFGDSETWASSVLQTETGEYFVAGVSDINHDDQLWVASFSNDLTIIKQESFGGSNEDGAGPLEKVRILRTDDGGLIIPATTRSHDGDALNGGLHGPNNYEDVWLVKLKGFEVEGPDNICLSGTETYTVDFKSPATTTTWSVSSNMLIVGPSQGNSVTIAPLFFLPFGAITATNGDYTVSKIVNILTASAFDPGTISGPNGFCPDGVDGGEFSISPAFVAPSYTWSIQGNAKIVGSPTGTSCFVEDVASIFTITVKPNNCGALGTLSTKLVNYYSSKAPECDLNSARVASENEVIKLNNEPILNNIYPNPVQNLLSIALDREMMGGETKLLIIDTNGKTVWSDKYQEHVDIGSLPAGLYILVVQGGKKRSLIKFVKE